MSDPKQLDAQRLARALRSMEEDVLDADYPVEQVDEELRETGLDPEAVARRGRDFVAGLLAEARADHRREVVARGAPLADRVARARALPRPSREEMLARIARAEKDPRHAGAIAVAARGRRPDEPTDEEVAALWDKLVALGIVTPDGDA